MLAREKNVGSGCRRTWSLIGGESISGADVAGVLVQSAYFKAEKGSADGPRAPKTETWSAPKNETWSARDLKIAAGLLALSRRFRRREK